jgi:hypothetical protein
MVIFFVKWLQTSDFNVLARLEKSLVGCRDRGTLFTPTVHEP